MQQGVKQKKNTHQNKSLNKKKAQSTKCCCKDAATEPSAATAAELRLFSCHPTREKPPASKLQGSMENMNLILGSVFPKSAQFQ